jgi:hypothetical protein
MGSPFQIGKRALGMMSWTAWFGSFSRSMHSGGTWMLAPGSEARQHEAEQQGQTRLGVAYAGLHRDSLRRRRDHRHLGLHRDRRRRRAPRLGLRRGHPTDSRQDNR